MALTVNEVFEQFQNLISADGTLGLARKEVAFNEGYLFLLERMLEKGNGIDELLVSPTSLTGTISQNYVPLPSDFFKFHSLEKKSGTQYLPFTDDRNITFDQLLKQTGSNFFVTTDTGEPGFFSVKKPRIYFDKFFSATDAHAMKLSYWQMPASVDFYNLLTLTSVVGVFGANDVITGASSGSTATISEVVSSTSIKIASESITGSFTTEAITGTNSAGSTTGTGTITAISVKPQTLELGREYKTLLATAIAVIYLTMRRMYEEAAAMDQTLDNLIKMRASTDKNKRQYSFGAVRGW